MSCPIPAPRSSPIIEQKKPVPTPRKLISINTQDQVIESSNNTFSRRVRTLGNTSKQLTGEFAERVQEKKKAVIEGTRQSVRRITRRFTTAGCEQDITREIQQPKETFSECDITNPVFNSISFQSPIKSKENESIYNNVNTEEDRPSSCGSDDSVSLISLPPPQHPPPPLREDSIYDQPQSLASGSSNSSENMHTFRYPYDYESVFPLHRSIPSSRGVARNSNVSPSESWNYYDPVSKNESIYSNVDNTPVLEVSGIGNVLTPEVAISEIIEKNISHAEVRNALYENHILIKPPPRTKKLNKRATNKSLMLQFDPLTGGNSHNDTNVPDLKVLEELLQSDLYGGMLNESFDNWSTTSNEESEIGDYLNPPMPPARFDSLLPEEQNVTSESNKSTTSWFVGEEQGKASGGGTSSNSVVSEQKISNWFKQVNEILKKAPDMVYNNKSGRKLENVIERAMLASDGVVTHKGMLYKVTNGPVEDLFGEFGGRWCILENGSFSSFTDNTGENVKEQFSLDSILSIQAMMDQRFKFKYENENLHCIEINVSGKSRGGHIYGSRSVSERRIWMQRFAESLTNRFPIKVISDYSRIGWAYMKEGVSGEWTGVWLLLGQRTLHYAVDNHAPKHIDLRKARCIILQKFQETEFIPHTNDRGPNMVVDCSNSVIYLRMWTTRETKVWCHIVRLAAYDNGALLEQQQLTKNNIPVIVEKCINFIYAHGSMSEGIYRRAGSGSVVQDILTRFQRDAWAVQLTIDKYSEHDVATALKRFFRDLPEPLLSTSNRQYFYQVSLVSNVDEKIRMFKAAFDQFTPITYKTIRRLLGHLHFITTQHKQNLMTGDNLAAVWGPTLMHCAEKDDAQYGQKESAVVLQLISFYRHIFPENPEEIEQERLMLQVLERCLKSPQGPVNTKASGDLRIWVYVYNKEGETYNIAIGPQKTAYEICVEISSKIKLQVHELQLEELVLNDSLTRPIHHTEKVLDVVLRWGYWEESDRKDNSLILSPISKYWEYIQENPLPVSGELKFADCKSKTFRTHMFDFAQAKLSYYKDKTCLQKINSWKIEDILWYIGHEPRRNPQSKWTITFILRTQPPKRTKTEPWFGNIIVWNNPGVRASWLASMLKAEHPKDLIPSPQHVNLMSG